MASEIKGVTGQGFFSTQGELKSKEAIRETSAQESSPAAESGQAPIDDSGDALTADKITRVFENISGRVSVQTSQLASVANRAEANLSEAAALIKEQLKSAKDLKKAIKDGNTVEADAARQKLQSLQEERTKLAQQIESDNREDDTSRTKNLSVGNQQKGIIQVSAVRVSGGETPRSLDSVKEVNDFISSLKEDKQSINEQKNKLEATKSKIEVVFTETRKQLSRIESSSIQTFGEADKVAEDIASAITKSGAQSLLVNNINESVAQALLG